MTSNHPWLADVFYLIGGILFLAKFLTWEETRQQDKPKRQRSQVVAIGSTFLVLGVAIAGNHLINPLRKAAPSAPPNVFQSHSADKSAEVPRETPPEITRPSARPLKPPTFVEKQGDYIVSLGGNTASIPSSGGMAPMLGSGDEWLVRAHVENGKFLVDAKLFSGRNSGAVLMERNQFSIGQASWDRNFDDSAFEAVNENLVPVLQIIYSLPRRVEIFGLFGDRPLVISPKGIAGLAPGTPITPENYPVKRIFKYPSRRYQGQELEVDQSAMKGIVPARTAKASLTTLSDGQRFVIKQELDPYAGKSVRLIRVGSDTQAAVVFEQLIDVFKKAHWTIQTAQIETVSVVGANFPRGPYLTGPNIAAPIIGTVFSIFNEFGVGLPLTPDAYAGPASMGTSPDVVIIIQ